MQLVEFFLPAVREDPLAARRARIVVGISLSLAVVVAAGLALRLTISALHPIAIAIAVLAIVAFSALPWLLRWTGRVALVSVLTTLACFVLVFGVAAVVGGLDSPVLVVSPLIPIFATFLLGSRAGVVTTLVLLATAALFLLFPRWGIELPDSRLIGDEMLTARALLLTCALVLAVVFAALYERQRADAEAHREATLHELAEKNADLERFTYTVSHDLKSPLVTVRGFLDYLEKDVTAGDPERIRSDISHIRGAVDKMQALIDGLLELTRIGRQLEMKPGLALAPIVRDAVSLLAGRIAAHGVAVEIAEDLPEVRGDRSLLQRALQNLIDNAVKFSAGADAPRVRIGARRAGDRVVAFVEDNGCGIAPGDRERVFGLFERLQAKSEGSGIGLATVRRAIEAQGGRVWVESAGKGRGSTFYFTLPAS